MMRLEAAGPLGDVNNVEPGLRAVQLAVEMRRLLGGHRQPASLPEAGAPAVLPGSASAAAW